MPTLYTKALMFGIMPVIFGIIAAFVLVIIKIACKRKSPTFRLIEKIIVTFFVLIYVLNPIIIKINFSLFNCF